MAVHTYCKKYDTDFFVNEPPPNMFSRLLSHNGDFQMLILKYNIIIVNL